TPIMSITQGVTAIANGSGSYNFGSVADNASSGITFTINNTGTGPLTLSGSPIVAISGSNADQFSVTSQPSGTVVGDSSTPLTYVLAFAPTSAGSKTATISIANGDTNNNPYTYTVTGTAGDAPAISVQPTDQSVTSGSAANFSVTATGTATLTYQWQVSTD